VFTMTGVVARGVGAGVAVIVPLPDGWVQPVEKRSAASRTSKTPNADLLQVTMENSWEIQ
jgi:hypothetical protein